MVEAENRPSPLRRNRDFLLLQVGLLLSATGGAVAAVAYPLIVLAVTHSPALAGVVTFARMVPSVLLGPLAGVLADRCNRKALMMTDTQALTLANARPRALGGSEVRG